MDKKKKIIIIGLASAILIFGSVAAYLIIKPKKNVEDGKDDKEKAKDDKDTDVAHTTPTKEEIPSKSKVPSTDSVIKIGAKGKRIGFMQLLLNYVYNAGIDVDGAYGEQTKAAVKKYLGYYCYVGDCSVSSEDLMKLVSKANTSSSEFKAYLNSNKGYKNVLNKYE